VVVSIVTETKQRNLETGRYDRVTVTEPVQPGSTPWMEVQ